MELLVGFWSVFVSFPGPTHSFYLVVFYLCFLVLSRREGCCSTLVELLLYCGCLCSISLPHNVVGWTVV